MVSASQIKNGAAAYIDREILAAIPAGTVQRVLMGAAAAVVLQRMESALVPFLGGEIPRALQLSDGAGNIDIDVIRDALRAEIPPDGVPVKIPGAGVNLKFKPADVDAVYNCIMEAPR